MRFHRGLPALMLVVQGLSHGLLSAAQQLGPNPTPVKVTSVSSGKTLIIKPSGDSVYPRFSPDGRALAYSTVVSRKGVESTAVMLYDLAVRKSSTLLSAAGSERYATYSSFVTDMEWRSPGRLQVSVSDGDVDSTVLLFDTRRRRLIGRAYVEPGLEELPPDYTAARNQALSLFRDLDSEVLDGALRNSPYLIPDRGLILQKNHAGEDRHIWLLDFKAASMTRLFEVDQPDYSLIGAVRFRESVLLCLASESGFHLLAYKQGAAQNVASFSGNQRTQPIFKVKYQSPDKIIFLIQAYPSNEIGDNPLFLFDGMQLIRAGDYRNTFDVDVDRAGRRIAFCFWQQGKRHIAIRDLKL